MFSIWGARNTGVAVAWGRLIKRKQQQMILRLQSTAVNVKSHHADPKSLLGAFDAEWLQSQPYEALPGLTKYQIVRGFIKGGDFANLSVNEFFLKCRERFGDIFRMPALFGHPTSVVLFNINDFEKVFRTEGVWPQSPNSESVIHYRRKRKDGFFDETLGLAGHGEDWGKFRHAVNPVLMQPQNAKLYLEPMQKVNLDFIQRIRDIRDPETLEVPGNFLNDINRLSFESVAVVALDHEFGLIRRNPNSKEARVLFDNIALFLKYIYDLDVKPSLYKYIPTPAYRRFEKSMDSIFDITHKYVNEALSRLEKNPSATGKERSVLEKLLKIDRKIAMIMAMDMLIAGVDVTSTVLVAILLCAAKNPEKQQKLREELLAVLPHKDECLTIDNMKHLPYLRACIKEALRVYPIGFGNMRVSGADLVLSGYRVPKGTRVFISSNLLLNEERFFPRAQEYLPERWLRKQQGNVDECPKLVADNLNKFIYLPFGFGPRSCAGKRIVDLELEMALANVVRNFKIEYNYPTEKPFKNHLINSPAIPLNFKFIDLH